MRLSVQRTDKAFRLLTILQTPRWSSILDMRKVIVLDAGVAEAISDILHEVELKYNVDFTEFQDEMWGKLTGAILQAQDIDE
jgi:hypothetical protein